MPQESDQLFCEFAASACFSFDPSHERLYPHLSTWCLLYFIYYHISENKSVYFILRCFLILRNLICFFLPVFFSLLIFYMQEHAPTFNCIHQLFQVNIKFHSVSVIRFVWESSFIYVLHGRQSVYVPSVDTCGHLFSWTLSYKALYINDIIFIKVWKSRFAAFVCLAFLLKNGKYCEAGLDMQQNINREQCPNM